MKKLILLLVCLFLAGCSGGGGYQGYHNDYYTPSYTPPPLAPVPEFSYNPPVYESGRSRSSLKGDGYRDYPMTGSMWQWDNDHRSLGSDLGSGSSRTGRSILGRGSKAGSSLLE